MGVGHDPCVQDSRRFEPFAFQDCPERQKAEIRAGAEELDFHCKRASGQYGPGLTEIGHAR